MKKVDKVIMNRGGSMQNSYERPKLEAKRLLLPKLDMSHLDDLFEVYSNPQTTTYVPRNVHKNKEETRSLLEKMMETTDESKSFIWSVIYKGNQKVIGTCGMWVLPNNSASLGAVISPLYWGKGFIVEALEKLIKFGFQELSLNRIEGRCDVKNIASERVMQKLKMTYEGTLRQSVQINERYCDSKVYSLLKQEYDSSR
ncbi:GNAT family N-acetyltransferase [Bacillus cereus]|uniref:GNAT family N-acetyltransferase n=2 Tax=Bacillus cereus TaxID=1396 RepID=A0AA44TEF6_BACCE|nr:GNAT family N-acetyltransferase [Bacillus cereus]PFO85642.1 GNAT family N-acetyltransferase [Bacillus cereus]PFR96844.1 GNAT family N-acetyltransferase [Bacillus cereus]